MEKENKENEALDDNAKREKKMTVMSERMQLRENERQQEAEQKKLDKEKVYRLNTEIDSFDETFTKLKESFLNGVEKSESVPKDSLNSHFDDLTRELQKMQKFLGDSTVFLPAYDIKRVQGVIRGLEDTLKNKQDLMQPKKKFGFKGKKKKGAVKETDKVDGLVASGSKVSATKRDPSPAQFCGFSNKKDEKLKLEGSELLGKDVTLNGLDKCEVRLLGVPSTLHITNVTECTILVGPVQTSVFIQDCSRCSFVMACQQLRTHGVTDSEFYLHVTSRAIIEDCHGVRFAPYMFKYDGQEEHYKRSGLDRNVNNWQSVDDFNWLALNNASPNWSVIPSDKRKSW